MSHALLDRVMDATVVPGYTRVGHAVRSRDYEPLPRMDGRTVLVTGATSGLGRAAAEGFAGLGARLLLLARDRSRGTRAAGEIARATGNAEIDVVLGDLADLASVRAAAEGIPALDVLVHNAGAFVGERRESPDGIELTLATNVIGPFALTAALADRLAEAAPARIVTVSSGGMYTQALDLDDLQCRAASPTAARRSTPARSAPRSSSPRSGTAAWRAAGSPPTRCTPAGSTRPASRPPSPASTASWARCCARPRRAPTRSSGSARPRSRCGDRAASGTTAGSGRSHACRAPARRPEDALRLWEACERLAGL